MTYKILFYSGTGIRFLVCDEPSIRALSTSGAWYETTFGVNWNAKNTSEKVKIAYGKKESILQSKIEKLDLTFKGMGRQDSDTFTGFYSDSLNSFYKKYSTDYEQNGTLLTDDFAWYSATEDILNFVFGLTECNNFYH